MVSRPHTLIILADMLTATLMKFSLGAALPTLKNCCSVKCNFSLVGHRGCSVPLKMHGTTAGELRANDRASVLKKHGITSIGFAGNGGTTGMLPSTEKSLGPLVEKLQKPFEVAAKEKVPQIAESGKFN